MQDDTINFYDAIRLIENADKAFSISWCTYSTQTGKGGKIITKNDVIFDGKRVTDDYELLFFKEPNNNTFCCHLFSIMFFNGKKMII